MSDAACKQAQAHHVKEKEGVCVHGWESVPCAQGCGQQGVWKRACGKPIQTSKIVTMYDVLLHGEVRRA
eukprot:1158539-Pelagomonas_calceolata.AAC.1